MIRKIKNKLAERRRIFIGVSANLHKIVSETHFGIIIAII